AGVGSTVVACTARSCTTGFSIGQGSHVTDSTAKDCSQDGFSLATEVRLTHCLADNNNVGIRGASACHIEQNTATNNTTTGIIAGAGTLLVRNAATGNASAFDTTGANAGPVETSAATATSPWANLAY
ncbi:MAG: right-handed parallel beta-helix repeat-containing protein, partial [Planctomycetota bacterium]